MTHAEAKSKGPKQKINCNQQGHGGAEGPGFINALAKREQCRLLHCCGRKGKIRNNSRRMKIFNVSTIINVYQVLGEAGLISKLIKK